MKRFFLLLIVALVVGGGWGAYVLLTGFEKSFPPLAPGLYSGSIRLADGKKVLPWMVEQREQERDVTVFVADPRFQAQRVALQNVSGTTRSPLVINGEGTRLRLSGREGDGAGLEGYCLDPISGEEGTWRLTKSSVPAQLSPEQASELVSWLSVRRDVAKVDAELEAARRTSDAQRARIDKLQRYVVDEDALKETAASRLDTTTQSIQSMTAQVERLRTALDEAIRTLETAERVSPVGNLVLLSRETLQRESRWVELTLQLLAPETSPGFEQSLERAYRIKALQDQIADERRKIADLENSSGIDEYDSEEEFYRGMGQ